MDKSACRKRTRACERTCQQVQEPKRIERKARCLAPRQCYETIVQPKSLGANKAKLQSHITEVERYNSMTVNLRFIIIIALSLVWEKAGSSIVGVTYMDDFDFEQRYRNVHECDPFYWHPLHMPEDCADMYEKLIRNRLPTRILKHSYIERKHARIPRVYSYKPYEYQYMEYPDYEVFEAEMGPQSEMTPYEKMLESVKKDVKNLPSVPSVKNMPNFGPVAVYQQPVSRISADMIKEIALTYSQPDDEKGKRDRHRKGRGRWKQIVDKMRRRERQGWKKINNGDIVSLTKT